jgi:hypothetical protein
MIEQVRAAIIARLGVTIMIDAVSILEELKLSKEEFSTILIDAMIYTLQRGEERFKLPLVAMLEIAAKLHLDKKSL